ncbi:hypothetical protein D3C87_1390800 [compost metagenome]
MLAWFLVTPRQRCTGRIIRALRVKVLMTSASVPAFSNATFMRPCSKTGKPALNRMPVPRRVKSLLEADSKTTFEAEG